ncbi:MAG: hypothetical protein CMP81_00630 [Fulvimarina sp.]|nr:hypothetical protein [Fulvimarina sp.]
MKWVHCPAVFGSFLFASAVAVPAAPAQEPVQQIPAAPAETDAEQDADRGGPAKAQPSSPQSAAPAAANSGTAATAPEAAASAVADADAVAGTVERFLARPAGLLEQHPQGGPALTEAVRRLTVADERTVGEIVAMAKEAPPRLQAAMGRGLAKAALELVATQPERAAQLQEVVAASGLDTLQIAFRVEQNDIDTATLSRLPGDVGPPPPASAPAAIIRAADGPAISGSGSAGAEGASGPAAAAPGAAAGEALGAGSSGFLAGLAADAAATEDDTAPTSPTR